MNALVNTPARIGKVGAALVAMCVATVSLVGVGTAGAQSSTGSAGSFDFGSSVPEIFRDDPGPLPVLRDDITAAAVVGEERTGVQTSHLTIASPALKREVGVEVLLPADNSVPRPTLYMLQGVDGGEGSNGWVTMGGAPAFFADKNAYVVMINGGSASLFSDWESADPALGLHKWETFIAKELPPLIDDHFGTNGVNAIAGTSMGA
jgi:S-formylglutathione hydrolase FrmB